MPLVFVHGVATRQAPDQAAATAQRTALFREIVFNSSTVTVLNPDWGTHGVIFSPDLPWLPVPGQFVAFAAGSDAVHGRAGGEIGLSGIAARDAAQAIDLLVLASLNEATEGAGASADIGRQRDAIRLAKAAADYLGATNVVVDDSIKGLARLDGGNDAGFAQALANDLAQLPETQAYGGGYGQAIKDALASLGGWIGNGVSDVVLKAKRADLSRSAAFFLGDIFVYLRHRDRQGPDGDVARLFTPIVDDLIRAFKAPRADREPFVVVGHSLGGVLLYDLLTDPACIARLQAEAGMDFTIDLLLTVGSQPGFFKDLRMYEKGQPEPQTKLPRPAAVRGWLNVFDYTDIFSFTCAPFFEGVQDFGYDSKIDVFQAHSAYFRRPSFYKRLQVRLQGMGFL